MYSSHFIFIFPTSLTILIKYRLTESLHPIDIWLYDNFGSCNRIPVLTVWRTFEKALTFMESVWCCCKCFTDSLSFKPTEISLKYYPSDTRVFKNRSVISTRFPPKIVFLTLAWRPLSWGCWNLKMVPWYLYFKFSR